MSKIYSNRNVFDGVLMALSIMTAYGLPLITRKVSLGWLIVVNPIFVVVMVILGALSMLYLWKYKHYTQIMRTALHKQRS